ncbi:P4 family phage/plasmid primase-like protein [Bradyrhizobium sp. RT9b]|uniref:DNA primase family protein n=1 Tax=unclassified Bradyrhizobium TaxID=2631580 RepID=UPI00339AE847
MNAYVGSQSFPVTIFADQYAKKKEVRQWSLAEMRSEVLKTTAATKKELPWIKMAEFGANVMPRSGSLRHDANVLSVAGCELDYDDGLISIEEAAEKLQELKVGALVYTSPSNTKTKFKWRIMAPFSSALPPAQRKRLAIRLNSAFGNIFDRASFALSQSFYYGMAEDNGAADHKAIVVDGHFVDLCDHLASFDQLQLAPPPAPSVSEPVSEADPAKQIGYEFHLSRIGDGEKSKYDGFNNPLTRATGAYARQNGAELDRELFKETLRRTIREAPKKDERQNHEIERYLSDSYLDNLISTAIAKYALKGILVSDKDHWARASKMRQMQRPNLLHYRDDYFDWEGGAYRHVEDLVINAETWRFLNGAVTVRKLGKQRSQVPFKPNRASVGETQAALKAIAILDPAIVAPAWIDDRKDLPAEDIIAFPNGLLDVRDNKFHPLDPAFFTMASLGFDYVANAAEPKNWISFLNQIYQGEDAAEEIALVQEIFGYLLTGDISQEKAFFFLGPKRSGKGTMIRMMQHLLARSSVAGPTLKSLDTTFGLAPLIDKQLAIIDDLRIVSGKEQGSMVENILKITGRGLFTIDRKFKTSWTGILPVKLIFVSNLMPKFGDESGALASRIITSTTQQSFFGREDPRLFRDKLLPELLGIFHWALVGLRRLRERGHFKETDGSKEAREQLAHLGSPVMGFIADECQLHPDKSVHKKDLFSAWREYERATNTPSITYDNFFNALYAAAGGKVHAGKRRNDGKQIPCVWGIGLKMAEPAARSQPDLLAEKHL